MDMDISIVLEGVRDARGMIAVGALKWDDDKKLPACVNGDWEQVVGYVSEISRADDGWIKGKLSLNDDLLYRLGVNPELSDEAKQDALEEITVGSAYMSIDTLATNDTVTDAKLLAVYLTAPASIYEGTNDGPGTSGG